MTRGQTYALDMLTSEYGEPLEVASEGRDLLVRYDSRTYRVTPDGTVSS